MSVNFKDCACSPANFLQFCPNLAKILSQCCEVKVLTMHSYFVNFYYYFKSVRIIILNRIIIDSLYSSQVLICWKSGFVIVPRTYEQSAELIAYKMDNSASGIDKMLKVSLISDCLYPIKRKMKNKYHTVDLAITWSNPPPPHNLFYQY